ncbi:MAG: TolC family protein [Desulfobacterales bacterium]|nr:TolC family protein [Desulfobacterales bacterium]
MVFLSTVFSCLCLSLTGAGAQEVLTWQACVNEARQNHPDLISAKEVVNQSKADRAIAISTILPQVSTEVRQSTSKSHLNNTTDTAAYGITAQQLLFDGLKTPYDIAAAAKNVKSTQYTYVVTSSDIRLRLRTAFIALLNAQELLTITKDISMLRKQNADLVKLLYEGGREHRGALLTAEANRAQADLDVVQAQRAITVAQRQLCKEMGRSEVRPIQVTGDLDSITVKQEKPNFEALAPSTPFLENLSAKKEAAQFGLKSAKAAFFPQIFANASAGRTDTDWPPHNDDWSVGVTLTFPIFEGGRRWADVSKARAVLNQAQADERSNRDGVTLTLEQSWTNWQNAIDTVAVQKEVMQAAEEREKIARVQYTNGLITFDSWTIIEDALVQARKSLLAAQANGFISEAQWIQAQGGTLDHAE